MALQNINTDAKIITEVRTLTGEPVARRFTDTELTRWINQGYDIILSRNLAFETIVNQVLSENADTYAISDIISVAGVFYTAYSSTSVILKTNAKGLLRMHPRHYGHLRSEATGPPQEYYWFGDTLYIWPTPASGQAGHYIKILAYTRDASFASNAFANLDPYYHPYLVWFTYAMALRKLGKIQQAFQYMSYFNNFIDFHKQTDLSPPVDSEDMMNLPDRTQFI